MAVELELVCGLEQVFEDVVVTVELVCTTVCEVDEVTVGVIVIVCVAIGPVILEVTTVCLAESGETVKVKGLKAAELWAFHAYDNVAGPVGNVLSGRRHKMDDDEYAQGYVSDPARTTGVNDAAALPVKHVRVSPEYTVFCLRW